MCADIKICPILGAPGLDSEFHPLYAGLRNTGVRWASWADGLPCPSPLPWFCGQEVDVPLGHDCTGWVTAPPHRIPRIVTQWTGEVRSSLGSMQIHPPPLQRAVPHPGRGGTLVGIRFSSPKPPRASSALQCPTPQAACTARWVTHPGQQLQFEVVSH